jgi:enoyl-CoA hydratase
MRIVARAEALRAQSEYISRFCDTICPCDTKSRDAAGGHRPRFLSAFPEALRTRSQSQAGSLLSDDRSSRCFSAQKVHENQEQQEQQNMSAAVSSCVLTRVVGAHVLHVTINRAHVRNAVDGPTALALRDAFSQFDRDPRLHVAVLSGEGATFCAGADLKAIAEAQTGGVATADSSSSSSSTSSGGTRLGARANDVSRLGPMGPTALRLSKPVIAAINGFAVAGGLELACWCDLRVVSEDAQLGVLCRRVGVPLIDGGTVRLPRLIGQSRALDLILTGRLVGADEALHIGLANRVVKKPESAVDAALALAAELAALPQACMRADRASVIAQWDSASEEAALWDELRGGRAVLATGESVAGARRFSEAGAGRHGASMTEEHAKP